MTSQSRTGSIYKKLANTSLFLAVIVALVWVGTTISPSTPHTPKAQTVAKSSYNPFATTTLVARAAVVYDIDKHAVIFAKNKDDKLALASITKVLTAVTAEEMAPLGTTVTINSQFLAVDGDSGFYKDEQFKLSDLINYSLVTSSNDGMTAIAGAAGAFQTQNPDPTLSVDSFVQDMNTTAIKAGMQNGEFHNPSGLDISQTEAGDYASALDVAHLFAYTLAHYPDILSATKYPNISVTSLNNITHKGSNTDTLVNSIPGLVASKTGYTDIAGGNLAIVFDPGLSRPIAIVVLGSTYDDRFSDVKTLADKTLEYIEAGN